MTATQYTNWFYNFEDHNNIGGVGYFSSEYTGPGGPQSDNPIPNHTVYTQNNEYLTYAIRNKVWQSDVDIKVSNFVQNTGAGITEHIYQERGRGNHDMNYNLYYTIDVENPSATIYADKQRAYDGKSDSDQSTTPYDTTADVYEFDVRDTHWQCPDNNRVWIFNPLWGINSSCAPSKGQWLYANNDLSVKELIEKLNKKLVGHCRYYGVSYNGKKLGSFLHFTQRYLCKALNRRSQKKSYTWDGFADMLKVYPLAKPKIYVRLF